MDPAFLRWVWRYEADSRPGSMPRSPGIGTSTSSSFELPERPRPSSIGSPEAEPALIERVASASHGCYTCGMTEVASRELRNDTRGLLERVARGEEIVITISGQPVAMLTGLRSRPRWVSREDFVARVEGARADPELARDLAELLPDTTDDIPL